MVKKRNCKSSKWLSIFMAFIALLSFISFSLPTEVHAAGTILVTYPNPPGGAALNTNFTVKVRANGGAWQDLDEYDTTVGGYHPSHASFVYFDTDGPVDVSVTYNAGTVLSAAVRPTSKGITPAINGNTLTFTISGPTKLSVEVNGDINHNLHLFANPLEVNPPSPSDPNVIYLAPGVYKQDYTVPSGKTLYIAGGAVVKGGVFLDGATNAAVRGRGILDHPNWRGISVNYAENITVDGIIVNDYGMGGWGGDLVDLQNANNVTINNIKGFSYKSWTDGIDTMGSTNVTVNDGFIRSGDDCMAIYTARKESNFWDNTTNLTVTNMILMPDVARPINFGTHGDPTEYEGGLLIDSVSFSNIDIMLNNTGSPMSPIQFTNGDGNLIQNIQFTDIRIEDNYVNKIVNINNVWTSGQTGPGRGIKNVYFKNITYTGNNTGNGITGYSPTRMVQDVTFENLVVNGNLILTPAAGNINIGSNTSNIQVVPPGGASYTPIPVPTPLYTNLALNAAASSDSEKPGNPASSGNDGNLRTNWTANDTNTGHWWKVDLGSNKTIHGTKVIWDSNNLTHLYKIEISTDNTNWTTVVDRTAGNSTYKTNNDPFNATARYVRITVTGMSAGLAASFNEFRVLQNTSSSLVKNGDFENGNTVTWTGVGQAISISAAYHSTFGVELKNPGNYIEQTITGLSPNTPYFLTVNAKGVSGTGHGYVYVKDYGAAQINQNVISDNNFHSTIISFVTGPTSTSATIGAYCTTTRVQFDDFALSDFETFNIDFNVLPPDSYTKGSYYLYQNEVDRIKTTMNQPGADKPALFNQLIQAQGLPVPLNDIYPKINITSSMAMASSISWDGKVDAATNGWRAFDGDTTTSPDTKTAAGWVQADLGAGNVKVVGGIKFIPRPNQISRMNGALIQGSNDGTNFVTLYTINNITDLNWYSQAINSSTAYRYLRYYTPNGFANVGELELHEKIVDRTLLTLLLGKAAAINASLYTSESVAVLQTAVTSATSVSSKKDATQTEIDAASASMVSALEGLQYLPTASVNPDAPNGLNGWYTVPVTVTMSAYGNVEYTLNDASAWQPYASPLTLDQDSVNTLNYRLTNTTDVQSVTLKIDKTAPVTVATVNPSVPDGSNGWYDHPVTVTLSTYDNLSGVGKTEYSLDGGSTWQSYTIPVTFNQDGKYTVSYRSMDNAGNVEAVKTIGFNLDATAPTITVSGLVYGTYSDSMDITPILTLGDNLSGVDSSMTTVTVNTYGVQQAVQQGTTIPLYTLPLGSYTFIVTSSDLAGNIGSRTVLFQTTTSIQSMQALVTRFTNMGWIDGVGIAKSLQSKLADNALDDLVNEVRAQSGKHISVQAANYLLRDAQYLLAKN